MRVLVVKESLTTPLILAFLLALVGCAAADKPRTYTVAEFGKVLREELAIYAPEIKNDRVCKQRMEAAMRAMEPFTMYEMAKLKGPPPERWPRLVGQNVLILKWRLACAAYAAVCRAGRLSSYTWSGVLPSSAWCGLVWL